MFVVTLDALGTIPFKRSVRSYERPQMTALFGTYVYFSDLLPASPIWSCRVISTSAASSSSAAC